MGILLPLECSRVWEQVQWVDQDEEGLVVAQALEESVPVLAGLVPLLAESVPLLAESVPLLAESVP